MKKPMTARLSVRLPAEVVRAVHMEALRRDCTAAKLVLDVLMRDRKIGYAITRPEVRHAANNRPR